MVKNGDMLIYHRCERLVLLRNTRRESEIVNNEVNTEKLNLFWC